MLNVLYLNDSGSAMPGYGGEGFYVSDGKACSGPFVSREHAEVRAGETASLEVAVLRIPKEDPSVVPAKPARKARAKKAK